MHCGVSGSLSPGECPSLCRAPQRAGLCGVCAAPPCVCASLQVRACEGLVLCAVHRRDIGFLFILVQLTIAIIAKAVHLLDSGEVIPNLFPKEWAANRVATVLSVGPYYCTGAVIFFAGAPPPAFSNMEDLKINHAVNSGGRCSSLHAPGSWAAPCPGPALLGCKAGR